MCFLFCFLNTHFQKIQNTQLFTCFPTLLVSTSSHLPPCSSFTSPVAFVLFFSSSPLFHARVLSLIHIRACARMHTHTVRESDRVCVCVLVFDSIAAYCLMQAKIRSFSNRFTQEFLFLEYFIRFAAVTTRQAAEVQRGKTTCAHAGCASTERKVPAVVLFGLCFLSLAGALAKLRVLDTCLPPAGVPVVLQN